MFEKLKQRTIKQKMISMYIIGVIMALLVMFKIAYHWNEYYEVVEIERLAVHEVDQLINNIETRFLIQKNEWKNMLLRGQDADLYLQHLNAFKKAANQINEDVQALNSLHFHSEDLTNLLANFSEEHALITSRYVEALPVYQLAEHRPAETVDKYLWKVNDKAFVLLDEIHTEVSSLIEAGHQAHESQLRRKILVVGAFAFVAFSILTYFFWVTTTDTLLNPIRKLTLTMEDIAEGDRDLTMRLDVTRQDELGRVAFLYNSFMEKLQTLMTQVIENASSLTDASNKSQQITAATTDTIRVQQNAIANVAASMSQMAETVHVIADNASDAAGNAHKTNEEAEKGYQVTEKAVSSINQLSEEISSAEQVISTLVQETKNIGSIVGAINEISDQTNLLALNAAIEAARAGEHGRGFAVVADEVRTLAARTQGATEEVQSMIQSIQKEVNNAVAVMERSRSQATQSVHLSEEAGEALKQIMQMVSEIEQMNEEIADRSEQQSKVATDINQNINEINTSVEQTLNTAQQSISDNSDLAQLSMVLQGLIFQFKISEEQKRAGIAPANAVINTIAGGSGSPDVDDGVELF